MKKVQIILVQTMNDGGYSFRIQKLIGHPSVECTIGKKRNLHVGDVITEKEADDLADCPEYEVTVTEKLGR